LGAFRVRSNTRQGFLQLIARAAEAWTARNHPSHARPDPGMARIRVKNLDAARPPILGINEATEVSQQQERAHQTDDCLIGR